MCWRSYNALWQRNWASIKCNLQIKLCVVVLFLPLSFSIFYSFPPYKYVNWLITSCISCLLIKLIGCRVFFLLLHLVMYTFRHNCSEMWYICVYVNNLEFGYSQKFRNAIELVKQQIYFELEMNSWNGKEFKIELVEQRYRIRTLYVKYELVKQPKIELELVKQQLQSLLIKL